MRKLALALIVFSLWASEGFAAKYGGCWLQLRSTAFTTTMRTTQYSAPTKSSPGTVRLSEIYYTILDSLPAGDSIYTRGTGNYYSKDSSGSDTAGLVLDAFVGQTIQVDAFFVHDSNDTLFITVEQGNYYYPPASDSSIDHTSTRAFQFGFKVTDTLFQDTLNFNDATGANDTLYCLISGSTDYGHPSHHYVDSFVLNKPFVRIKVRSYNLAAQNEPIHFQLYCRAANEVMSGASGRLEDRQEFKDTNTRVDPSITPGRR